MDRGGRRPVVGLTYCRKPECRRAAADAHLKRYRDKNRERIYAANRARYAAKGDAARQRQNELRRLNHDHVLARTRAWRARSRDQIKAARERRQMAQPDAVRAYNLGKRYGLTLERYAALLATQGGRCAICSTRFDETNGPAVDHDHATGVVRGLLCKCCNRALGMLREDPSILRRGAEYLDRYAVGEDAA